MIDINTQIQELNKFFTFIKERDKKLLLDKFKLIDKTIYNTMNNN